MKSLVIFGTGELADVAHFYFSNDSSYVTRAFTVDSAHLKDATFNGLPVVPFEEIGQRYHPDETEVFVAIGYTDLNRRRAEKCSAAKSRGYRLASYVSTRATVWPGFTCGEHCFILEDNTIQPYTQVKTNTILWSGNHIGHHSIVGAHCYVAGHVVISGGVRIGDNCFIGARSTLRDHIEVGDRCIVGMGARIMSNAEPDGVYTEDGTRRRLVPSARVRRL